MCFLRSEEWGRGEVAPGWVGGPAGGSSGMQHNSVVATQKIIKMKNQKITKTSPAPAPGSGWLARARAKAGGPGPTMTRYAAARSAAAKKSHSGADKD